MKEKNSFEKKEIFAKEIWHESVSLEERVLPLDFEK